ncbi:MAG: DUF4404 family protein [Acidimicrobiales bacterium]
MAESLDELLARMKSEIEQAEHGSLDRAELARLAEAVERRLRDEQHDQHDQHLVDELRSGVRRLEATHPSLASAIGRLADGLAGMGL